MRNFTITYRIGPTVESTKDLYVEAPTYELAVGKATDVLRLRYPNFRIQKVKPGPNFARDSEELFAHIERLRARR